MKPKCPRCQGENVKVTIETVALTIDPLKLGGKIKIFWCSGPDCDHTWMLSEDKEFLDNIDKE